MKILIVGTGLSGCALAKLLTDRRHDVSLIEKRNYMGGLCITRVRKDGQKYEPFGARTFHSSNPKIIGFITRFGEFNGYTHRKGMIINGRLVAFPITLRAIEDFEDRDKIFAELKNRPEEIDKTNFETACISMFGETLYNYFIRNYTAKMWGTDPVNLTSEWAPKRLELRQDTRDELFRSQWQGLPRRGYSILLKKMIQGLPLKLKTQHYNADQYDMVVSAAPIDETMNFKYGKLQYRSMKFSYKTDEPWGNDLYGTINLPQHPKYIRKCNFQVLHKQHMINNHIQYQEPVEASEGKVPMYPINTDANNQNFDKYLREICDTKNVCPLGRLGLFKYLDMDKAVEVAFDMVEVVENFRDMTPPDRYDKITAIRERY